MPTWNAALAVGHPQIDAQHRELFARADELIEAMLQGRAAAEMEELFSFLRDYCREHFGMEEQLMAATRYPQSTLHHQSHREFERQFKELEDMQRERGPSALVVLGTKDLIRGWLVNHIGTVDMRLAAYLKETAAARAR